MTDIRPNPCATIGCAMQSDPIETCRDHRCPHRWQREAATGRGEFERMKAIGQIKEGT